jgi:hypothetical protein
MLEQKKKVYLIILVTSAIIKEKYVQIEYFEEKNHYVK